jgi:non-canonical purine NTP pyrophosphatase (RdgB/HAM1 family)
MEQVYLLTGSPGKIKAANLIFNNYEVEVLPLELDIPEIQASTSLEIARNMVESSYKLNGKPAIREDHSFFIKELGFPGPFMTYIDKTISPEQLLKIVNTLDSREAYFELGAAYIDTKGIIHEFSYQVPVIMAKELRGTKNLRWERLMMFPGDTKTFAELDEDDRVEIWTQNFVNIAKLIESETV